MADVTMRILITAQNNAASAIQGLAGNMNGLQIAALGAGAVLAGFGVAVATSVKAAADFQSGLTSLVTGAGELQSNLGMVSQGLLTMSVATGTSTQQLIAGLYMIESAGYHGAAGLSVLQAAAEGAKVGNADLGTVSNALTTILHDYGMSASQAVPAMNALITTVADGKTHMQDLAAALGNVLPLAASLHISFPQVAGAMAEMTNAGMSAQRASMDLSNTIRALAAPAASAQKAMAAVGISTQQLSDVLTHQGLQQALQMIERQVGEQFPAGSAQWTAAMKAILGGATGLNTALMLGGKNMAGYEANIHNIAAAMHGSSSAVQGWGAVQQTFNFKMQQAQAAVQAAAIALGTRLLPILSQLATAVTPLITHFAQWVSTVQANSPVLAVLGGVLAGLAAIVLASVVPSLIAMGAAMLSAEVMGAPLIAVVLAVIAVVTVVILVIQHWSQIAAFLKAAWAAVLGWLTSAFHAVGATIASVIAAILGFFTRLRVQAQMDWMALVVSIESVVIGVKNWLGSTWAAIVTTVVGWFSWLYTHNYYFKDLVDAIVTTFTSARTFITTTWAAITSWLSTTWNTIKTTASTVWTAIITVIQTVLTTLAAWLSAWWQAEVTGWTAIWTTVKGLAQSGWNAIVGVFSSAWTAISGPLGALWNQLKGWFDQLAQQAVQWGKNLIQGFINGITGMLGAVGQAAQNVMATIGNFLGFHSPAKMGEGQHIIEWGQNAVKGFLQGMNSMQPQLHAQLQAMVHAPAGNTMNTSHGPITINLAINTQGGLSQSDMDKAVSYLADRLRTQFGNI